MKLDYAQGRHNTLQLIYNLQDNQHSPHLNTLQVLSVMAEKAILHLLNLLHSDEFA